jgi:hypothetical protein
LYNIVAGLLIFISGLFGNTRQLTIVDFWQIPVVERRIELVEMKPRVQVEGRIETTAYMKTLRLL